MQKTVITVIFITIILLTLMVVESNTVDKYCDKLCSDVRDFKKELENSANASSDIEKIIDEWERKKNIIYVFVNHNSFDDIETELYNSEYYVKNNDLKKALYHSETLLQRVIELRGSFDFTLGNLL